MLWNYFTSCLLWLSGRPIVIFESKNEKGKHYIITYEHNRKAMFKNTKQNNKFLSAVVFMCWIKFVKMFQYYRFLWRKTKKPEQIYSMIFKIEAVVSSKCWSFLFVGQKHSCSSGKNIFRSDPSLSALIKDFGKIWQLVSCWNEMFIHAPVCVNHTSC